MIEVARRYTFVGVHHVPGLPAPWCERHRHVYTVEIAARSYDDCEIVVDTDLLDEAWTFVFYMRDDVVDMDSLYGAENTTVESLARNWLASIRSRVPQVYRVVAWEDESRWGSAQVD